MPQVLLSGNSAGGVGVFYNCDFLQAYLDEHLGDKAVQVSCAPVGGFYFPGSTEDQEDALWPPSIYSNFVEGVISSADEMELESNYINALQQRYVPPACTAANENEPWICTTTAAIAGSIQSRMYVVQYTMDKNAMSNRGLAPTLSNTCLGRQYIAYWGRAIQETFDLIRNNPNKPNDGFFLASCLDHTAGIKFDHKESEGGDGGTLIQDYTSFDGVADWFFNREGNAGAAPRFLEDDCSANPWGGACNPTCLDWLGFGNFQNAQQPAPDDCCENELQHLCGAADDCEACVRGDVLRLQQSGCGRAQVGQWCRTAR